MNAEFIVPSPCISVCTIDEDTGFCRGCFRNLMEVTKWKRLTNEEKQSIIAQLDERKRLHGGDRTGHY